MTAVTADPRATTTATSAGPRADKATSAFRGDIQGLRAVAVLVVLGFHAGIPWLRGGFVGVDVFFVISGFLITGLILREVEASGRLDLKRFWARRVRRLLPATAVALMAVAVVTLAVLPYTRWPSIAGDLASSAAYIVNWRLASNAVDYLALEAAPSPVQHFWSLAVEEQFYIVWPLLIVVLVAVTRWRSWALRRTLFVGITVLAAGSLAWSVHLTSADPGRAYFVSTTRVWELAIGAGLAIVAPRLAGLSRIAATGLGWLGLAAIMYAGVSFDVTTAFPGVAALVPTLGAAAVLAAGALPTRVGVDRVLSVPPMQDIGTLSYSLYLWHWPVLVGATAVWGRDNGTLWLPVAVMAVGFSTVPAWFTYRVIEAPIHHGRFFRSPPRVAGLGVGCAAIGLAAAIVVSAAVPSSDAATDRSDRPGAAVLEKVDDPQGIVTDRVDVKLDPVAATEDNADIYADGCHQDQQSEGLLSCAYGDVDSGTVIALVGDSHAAQWQPTLAEIATERGWRLETYSKSACGFFTVDVATLDGDPYSSCTGWNTNLRAQLVGPERPDLVIASSSVAQHVIEAGEPLSRADGADLLADGMREAWSELEGSGTEVVVLRDTPRRPLDTPECVAANLTRLTACSSGVGDSYADNADTRAIEGIDGIGWVDMTPFVCPGNLCPAVIGDVIVWRDRHHLTASYARSLAPFLDHALELADTGEFAAEFTS